MVNKLGYEWRKIYRACTKIDSEGLGIIGIDDFLKVSEKYGVSIVLSEQKQLLRLFKVTEDDDLKVDLDTHTYLNYKRLSETLGLHKESFNFLNNVHSQNKL